MTDVNLDHTLTCPNCGKSLSGPSKIYGGSKKPKPRDLSICCYCLVELQFTEDLQLIVLTSEAKADLPNEILLALSAARDIEKVFGFGYRYGVSGKDIKPEERGQYERF